MDNIYSGQENQVSEVDVQMALKPFNWGAFFFTYMWGLGNGSLGKTAPIFVCDILLAVPLINLLAIFVGLGLRIYAGINGNKWAYEGRAWYDLYDFTDTQVRWAKCVAVLVSVGLAFFFMGLFAAMLGGH